MKPAIVHYRHNYLPLTETFIYEPIIRISKYKPIILADRFCNLDLFPFDQIYSTVVPRWSWWWFYEALGYRVFHRSLCTERLLRREKTVIIHAHFGNCGVNMLCIKRKMKIPLITTFYGYDVSLLPSKEKWRCAYRELFRAGELFLVEGSHMRKALLALGCPEEKIILHHLGINLKKFSYLQRDFNHDGKAIILFCGRFSETKGLIYALQAIKMLSSKYGNLQFRIIGDGELRPKIERFIAQQNMSQYVVLLGYQPHDVFAAELKKADILLQPSVTAENGENEGGAPVVLLEAQASGLPVISTFHCDIPEYVVNEKSGFLVAERNPLALSERIEYLLRNPQQCVEMGKAGRKHVEENYDINKQVQELETIYTGIIR